MYWQPQSLMGRSGLHPAFYAFIQTTSADEKMAARPRYAVGDNIVLKDGFVRTQRDGRAGTITAILPTDSSVQYRVRFETENFDRRIVESDIDVSHSAAPSQKKEAISIAQSGSWLKTSSIRVRK